VFGYHFASNSGLEAQHNALADAKMLCRIMMHISQVACGVERPTGDQTPAAILMLTRLLAQAGGNDDADVDPIRPTVDLSLGAVFAYLPALLPLFSSRPPPPPPPEAAAAGAKPAQKGMKKKKEKEKEEEEEKPRSPKEVKGAHSKRRNDDDEHDDGRSQYGSCFVTQANYDLLIKGVGGVAKPIVAHRQDCTRAGRGPLVQFKWKGRDIARRLRACQLCAPLL